MTTPEQVDVAGIPGGPPPPLIRARNKSIKAPVPLRKRPRAVSAPPTSAARARRSAHVSPAERTRHLTLGQVSISAPRLV